MPAFLADTSVWVWVKLSPALHDKLAERARRGDLLTCVPVELELLHSSRDGREYDETLATLGQAERIPLTPTAAERTLEVQRALAHTTHGAHRIPAVDYLVAAVAEQHGAVLWHLDRDLACLCDFTGQPQEHERPPRRRR